MKQRHFSSALQYQSKCCIDKPERSLDHQVQTEHMPDQVRTRIDAPPEFSGANTQAQCIQ
jgi:hypothetical protein